MRQPATQQRLVLSRGDAPDAWGVGRAGMRYRDLIPDRLGGAFIASHIRILEGGPVPDAPFEGLEVLLPARDYKNRHASILLAVEAAAEAMAQADAAHCA